MSLIKADCLLDCVTLDVHAIVGVNISNQIKSSLTLTGRLRKKSFLCRG